MLLRAYSTTTIIAITFTFILYVVRIYDTTTMRVTHSYYSNTRTVERYELVYDCRI